ncbi:MAG: DHA2 family efflux MFS transporter permease subunit [Candidatus Eremiobacteraeota bacterium]|nr:DHA2 family efflux MFS transporter permease subunit [Candidatus Eremiobacteraeota bacterium]
MEDLIVQDRTRQRWIIFTTTFAAFMCVLDSTIVNISLPVIAHSFNVSTSIVARIVIVYLLVLTSTIPLFGKLGDRLGLTRVFFWGFICFTAGSLLCGISSSIPMLVFSRIIQGLGGAMLYSVPPALIPRFLPHNIRGASFGALTTAAALGLSLGAPVGGLITTHLSWQGIFLINIPVGIAAIIMVRRHFPWESPAGTTSHYFDIPGVLLSFSGIAALLYSLNMGQEMGWNSLPIIACFAFSLVMLVSFAVWETRCADPLLDLRIFAVRNYTLGNLANFFLFVFMAGNSFLIPFYLVLVKGLHPDKAGLIIMCSSVTMMIVAPLAGKASDTISPRILCSAGMLLAFSAFFYFSRSLGQESLFPAILFLLWLGASMGLFTSPNNNQIMSAAPLDKQGTASALMKTVTNLGSAIGVCLFETLFALSIPGALMKNGESLKHLQIPREYLLDGIRNAYTWGMLVVALAFLTTFLTVRDEPEEVKPLQEPAP